MWRLKINRIKLNKIFGTFILMPYKERIEVANIGPIIHANGIFKKSAIIAEGIEEVITIKNSIEKKSFKFFLSKGKIKELNF